MGSFVPKFQTSEWSWVARRRQKDTKCGRNSNCMAPQRHRQATPSSSAKRQAPARQKSPFQQLTAWRHLETAGRYTQSFRTVWWLAPGGERLPPGDSFRWCVKFALFLLFLRGETDLWHFGGTKNTFGELGGVLGLVGTAPSSSLYLFLFHLFHFASLSSPWQWRAKHIFVGVRCSHETLV